MTFWRAIPDVLDRRLSEAKPAEEGGVPPYCPLNMNRMCLKLTEISRSGNGSFSIVCKKCHVGDVTLGGASLFTSGFQFPVGHDLYRLTYSGDFPRNVYFRSERCSKV